MRVAATTSFVVIAVMAGATMACGGTLAGTAGIAPARRPGNIDTFRLGAGRANDRAPAEGIVALKPPAEGRVRIRGGRFVMGSTPAEMQAATELCSHEPFGPVCTNSSRPWNPGPAIRAEGHAHEVTLSTFDLDRTEVPVRAYGRCVAAGACAPPSFPVGDQRYDQPDFPVTHVRWDDAASYCAWVGGRLPTEAEWEYAAGGSVGHHFPWGDLWNSHLANHGSFATDPTDGNDGFVGLAPIASFPDGATRTGLYDMAGNASEWVSDFYDRDEEGYGYPRAAQTDPKGASFGPYGHVVRGGSYRDAAFMLRTTARHASPYATREIGFRCAYSIAANAGKP